MEPSDDAARREPAPREPAGAQAPTVDIRQLAERVYRLMLADLRMERARGVRVDRRKAR
jgi:hypothetical protein